jgi:hypothetical protein
MNSEPEQTEILGGHSSSTKESSSRRARRTCMFQAPAARQAVDRCDWYDLKGADRIVRVAVSDALGAIVAKVVTSSI